MSEYVLKVNDKLVKDFNAEDSTNQRIERISEREYHYLKDTKSHHAEILSVDIHAKRVILSMDGKIFHCEVSDALDQTIKSLNLNASKKKLNKNLNATMPGMVLSIMVTEGSTVAEGDPLMILEAMKMENVLKANSDGQISKIVCSENDAVDKGQLLIEII